MKDFVGKNLSEIESINYINNLTVIVLKNGKIGKFRKSDMDNFDMNIAIYYALIDAGIKND